jgi:hypothetical protein
MATHADFEALVQRIVEERVREYRDRLETLCEAALADPAGRGVLVVQSEDGSWEMSLDASVPYGTIHTRPAHGGHPETS